MIVLVTGASGFIGSHLSKYLGDSGYRVIALRRGSRAKRYVRVDPFDGSQLPDTESSLSMHMNGADAVVHLAARRQSHADAPLCEYWTDNVALTEDVALCATACGVGRVVFASSRMVYPGSLRRPAQETLTGRPDTMYGLSKRVAEDVISIYSAREGWTGVSLRLAQVFGNGDGGRGALGRFVDQAQNGERITVHGEGRAVRDVIYVRDVLPAVRRALEADMESGEFNIGSDRGYTVRELALAAATISPLGRSGVHYMPVEDEDESYYRMDCSRARERLGWRPEWGLEKSVHDMIASVDAFGAQEPWRDSVGSEEQAGDDD